MAVTFDIDGEFGKIAAEFAARPMLVQPPVRGKAPSVLDPAVVVPLSGEARELARLFSSWEDSEFAIGLQALLHEKDIERASQPPVIEVTVTPPQGVPAPPPGKYVVSTGPNQVVAFHPSPSQDTRLDLPVVTEPPRVRHQGRVTHTLSALLRKGS
jgi:hypothetical protein